MSERNGLLPWPSDRVYDLVSLDKPDSSYIDKQFFIMGQNNPATAFELEKTSEFFSKEFNNYCGKMHLFAGIQTHKMLFLAAQESKQGLPVAKNSITEVIEHSLEEADDYITQTFERLKEDNPNIIGYLQRLCKIREVEKYGLGAIRAVKSGGIFVYSMLELQAESDKMTREFL